MLYDLHFEFPGFNPSELYGVKITPGEHEKITVELTPVNG